MFLSQILDIKSLDLDYINELLNVLDDGLINEIREELAEIPLGKIDANSIIFSIFERLNRRVFTEIKQRLEDEIIEDVNEEEKKILSDLCQKRIDEFSPSINFIDSHFNNELDDVDLISPKINFYGLNDIIYEVITILSAKD
jgi:hypothetical protein